MSRRRGWTALLLALAIGAIFVVPDVARMVALHSVRNYSPFSVTTPNSMVWDESFLYAAQANTMLQQHVRADDTDSWEHRASLFPYSILPAAAEAAVATVLRPGDPRSGLKWAQIFFHFVFPCLMAWLLMRLLAHRASSGVMEATVALVIMAGAFSYSTFVHAVVSVLSGGVFTSAAEGAASLDTLQASRSPNPNISYVLVLSATLLLVRALATAAAGKRGSGLFVCAGLAGSLVFYAYSYYAIPWCFAVGLLTVLSLIPRSGISRRIGWTLLSSCAGAIPYLLWTRASRASGAYVQRLERLNMFYTHSISPVDVQLTEQWGAIVLGLVACWLLLRRRAPQDAPRQRMHAAVLVVAAFALGGIAGIDMELVTGFNVQAEFHFTHMVVQPSVALLAGLLLTWLLRRSPSLRWAWGGVFALLCVACLAAQARAGFQSAAYHRVLPADRKLFDWLEANSPVGSVVATTNLRVDAEMPVYTHNRSLVVNGTRAAGENQELVERLLLANRLAGDSPERLTEELRLHNPGPEDVKIDSYPLFLFERSPMIDVADNRFNPPAVQAALQRYGELSIPAELRRFRVDYLYTGAGEYPVAVEGVRWRPVLTTSDGTLWKRDAGAQ